MRRSFWIALLAGLAFAFIVIARFPAVWAAGALPKWLSCDDIAGTIWSGSCTGLALHHQQPIGDLSWQLQPARLLAARLAAHVQLTQGAAFLNGDLEWGLGQRLHGRDLHASFDLNPALLSMLPANLSGSARADLAYIDMKGNRLTDLRGRIEVHDLVQHQGGATPLGSYSLTFPGVPGGGEIAGELKDIGGPLALEARVRMTPEPGFLLDGKVASRASVAPELARQLQILGSPDAQGRRSFSIANTF
jgi:Type II secretion system (T2SS), protein N